MHLSDRGKEEGATMCIGRTERLVEAGRQNSCFQKYYSTKLVLVRTMANIMFLLRKPMQILIPVLSLNKLPSA